MRQLILAFASAVQSIDANSWDRLMGKGNPFCQHAYFLSLEQSLSACAATGWRPHHLCVFDATGSEFVQELAPDAVIVSQKDVADFIDLPLLALMPLYQKTTPMANMCLIGRGRRPMSVMALNIILNC